VKWGVAYSLTSLIVSDVKGLRLPLPHIAQCGERGGLERKRYLTHREEKLSAKFDARRNSTKGRHSAGRYTIEEYMQVGEKEKHPLFNYLQLFT
jgi:hypothetical protein